MILQITLDLNYVNKYGIIYICILRNPSIGGMFNEKRIGRTTASGIGHSAYAAGCTGSNLAGQ